MSEVLITGSTSGIGKAITELLLTEGYSVIGLARNHAKSPYSDRYHSYFVDFSNLQTLESQLKTIQKQHANITTIICCVGYGQFMELEQFSSADMVAIMNVNFLSQAILVKTFLPELKKADGSKIIFLGSECALEGQKKGTMYCASKFALRGFAQSLRKECASSQVSIALINPGAVATPFFDKLSFEPGKCEENSIAPEQIASLVSMLLKQANNCVFEEINLQPAKKVFRKKAVEI